MKLLVTGSKGQLGHDIIEDCGKRNIEVVGVDIEEMDITDPSIVEKIIKTGNYDAVIHCAAWTAVDKAEDEEDLCEKINVYGTANIAKVCEELDIPMMYFSTDYVFNGDGENFWKEYDVREPLSVYGRTKYEGELIVEKLKKHFIVRISWVFGINGNNFVKTMLKLGKERDQISVVNDQFGSPTYTYDLAKLSLDMIETNAYGTYHATNEGVSTWYDFACKIFELANVDVEVIPVDSSAFPVKAKRPKNSRMSKEELDAKGFKRLPDWEDALQRYIEVLKQEGII